MSAGRRPLRLKENIVWNDKSEPVVVDMEDIALFALREGKANKVSTIESLNRHNESEFNLVDGALIKTTHEKDIKSCYIALSISWENRAKVSIRILLGTMAISSIEVIYPVLNSSTEPLPEDDEDDFFDDYDLQEFKYFDPANWREAIMFAANEWWKDG